ncbi:hypothetical protein ACFVU4_21060 [Streptomyces sp. NPDC058107]|uniref:NrdR family transcriptional regulator n=1 Tax=Streptomyces sp. NPDC058107 TaxID=3346343 RepID=UPI0036F0E985
MRENEYGSIRRRRQCSDCRRRFTTVETSLLVSLSRTSVTEPFARSSVVARVRTAAQTNIRIVDAHARTSRSKRRSPVLGPCRRLVRHETDTSRNDAWSSFPLVPASGRG